MNKNIVNKILTSVSFLVLGLFIVLPSAALADYGAPLPPAAKILVEKKVFDPQSGSYVDNLTVNQTLFLPDQEVKFKVDVKNTGDKDFDNVAVSDRLPDGVTFVAGPGTFDQNSRLLAFTIDKLHVNETKSYEIKAKVRGANELVSNVSCMTNLAEAKVDNMIEQDTASFCVSKQVLGDTKNLPKTGAGDYGMMLALTLLASSGALYFSKKVLY